MRALPKKTRCSPGAHITGISVAANNCDDDRASSISLLGYPYRAADFLADVPRVALALLAYPGLYCFAPSGHGRKRRNSGFLICGRGRRMSAAPAKRFGARVPDRRVIFAGRQFQTLFGDSVLVNQGQRPFVEGCFHRLINRCCNRVGAPYVYSNSTRSLEGATHLVRHRWPAHGHDTTPAEGVVCGLGFLCRRAACINHLQLRFRFHVK